jgi:hypothetical protein
VAGHCYGIRYAKKIVRSAETLLETASKEYLDVDLTTMTRKDAKDFRMGIIHK